MCFFDWKSIHNHYITDQGQSTTLSFVCYRKKLLLSIVLLKEGAIIEMENMCVRILVLCLALLVSVSGVNSARQLYVHPTSDPTSVCPGEPCLTLDQYVENSDTYITSNTVFKLLPGQHDLTMPFVAQDVQNISIKPTTRDTVDLYYNQLRTNDARAALQFINATRLDIRGVNIVLDGDFPSVSAVSYQNGNYLKVVNVAITWSQCWHQNTECNTCTT